jgi:hypothetical protein
LKDILLDENKFYLAARNNCDVKELDKVFNDLSDNPLKFEVEEASLLVTLGNEDIRKLTVLKQLDIPIFLKFSNNNLNLILEFNGKRSILDFNIKLTGVSYKRLDLNYLYDVMDFLYFKPISLYETYNNNMVFVKNEVGKGWIGVIK